MRLSFIILLTFSSIGLIKAQNAGINGARSDAMGQVRSIQFDEWAAMNNPASMAFVESSSIALSYRNSYFLPELGTAGASFQYKRKNSAIGISGSRYGYEHFSDSRINLAYSLLLQKNISMGIAFSPQIIRFSNTGMKFYPNASLGFAAKLNDALALSGLLRNPFNQQVDEYSNSFTESNLLIASRYNLADNLLLVAEFEKNFQAAFRAKVGGEYQIQNIAFLRAGLISSPLEISYGAGIIFKQLKLDLALRQNPTLGSSGQIGLSFALFGKKPKDE